MPLDNPSREGGSTRRRFMVWRAEGSSGSIGNRSGVEDAGGGVDARALFSIVIDVLDDREDGRGWESSRLKFRFCGDDARCLAKALFSTTTTWLSVASDLPQRPRGPPTSCDDVLKYRSLYPVEYCLLLFVGVILT